ncbi:MAG: MBL fold metallo-hydrolase [Bacteroidales bacterium]|nr:MBL fold metallo-hydrolase [Bacteroidales bacterium]MCD8395314.1 MBL fold metallo-hydrolase [Bacteroidales bacterium]
MRLTFLGTGTSTGVPMLRCLCDVCRSSDPHDHRLRASALVEVKGVNLLIDCGPDFYAQMLRLDSPELDALLITHVHYDHVGGIDDLRPYCTAEGFPVYCRPDVARNLRERLPYCFATNHYPGAPRFAIHEIDERYPFCIRDVVVTPLPVKHYLLNILGYRIGRLAYITDAKEISDDTLKKCKGVDTLVINALRKKEHISHFTIDDALDFIGKVKPRVAYLIHMSHDFGRHADIQPSLPSNVYIAYDGLSIEIPD